MKRFLSAILLPIAAGCMIGCEELGSLIPTNKPPAIDRIYALRDRLAPADTTTVIVEARDPEGGALSFEWSKEGGTLSSTSGRHVLWTAPAAGNYKISVKVRDDKRGETQGQVTIIVLGSEKPTVKIVQPADGAFIPGLGVFVIEALASHPNGIQRVEFQIGTNSVGSANSSPYRYPWQVESLSGPATIIVKAFRAGAAGEPGIDSVRVSVEGVTRL
ncbi:Ig-like domain-containing protein [candidate division KSB1 bacterium]|nr:Ig-like domain-containing protein [candidate division KSB1 bacterium]